jgi:hypothetical protein
VAHIVSEGSRKNGRRLERAPTPPPVFVEVEGEMPTADALKVTPPGTANGSGGDGGVAAAPSSLLAKVAAVEEPNATEAVGIKVVKKKRKERDPTKAKKKKSTSPAASMSTPDTR